MYYRLAMQKGTSPIGRWRLDPLCCLPTVVRWLLHFRTFPPGRLRVFSCPRAEALDEQLRRANEGVESSSIPAAHFVPQSRSAPAVRAPVTVRSPAAEAGHAAPPLPASYRQRLAIARGQRREALGHGTGGDHDQPSCLSVPASTPGLLAWVKLLARVWNGVLRAEVAVLART